MIFFCLYIFFTHCKSWLICLTGLLTFLIQGTLLWFLINNFINKKQLYVYILCLHNGVSHQKHCVYPWGLRNMMNAFPSSFLNISYCSLFTSKFVSLQSSLPLQFFIANHKEISKNIKCTADTRWRVTRLCYHLMYIFIFWLGF